MIAGGSGITPMLQVAQRILANPDDSVWVESNWPYQMGATLWPFPPSASETAALFGVAAASAIGTYVAVRMSRW